MRTVILCSESGEPCGSAEVVEAHTGQGKLHMAFSVYLFTPDRQKILIQKRSEKKMLWPGIWANTCCSHPRDDETAPDAGQRRLKEEFGCQADLTPRMSYVYRAEDPDGRGVEHEHVTILTGELSEEESPTPNADEIADWEWIEIDELRHDMTLNPHAYAPWFHLGLKILLENESIVNC